MHSPIIAILTVPKCDVEETPRLLPNIRSGAFNYQEAKTVRHLILQEIPDIQLQHY